jgi:hypothetical protein
MIACLPFHLRAEWVSAGSSLASALLAGALVLTNYRYLRASRDNLDRLNRLSRYRDGKGIRRALEQFHSQLIGLRREYELKHRFSTPRFPDGWGDATELIHATFPKKVVESLEQFEKAWRQLASDHTVRYEEENRTQAELADGTRDHMLALLEVAIAQFEPLRRAIFSE